MITNEQIEKVLTMTPQDGADQLIAEGLGSHNIKSGDRVTVVGEDATYPYQGVVGRASGAPDDNGFTEVEWPNGNKTKVRTTELVPVKA